MIFVIGPAMSGKKQYIMKELALDEAEWERVAMSGVQELVREKMSEAEIKRIASELCRKRVVIADEVGSGVVPVEESERIFREQAGRLCIMLAEHAEQVIRVVCGIPQRLQ